MRAQPCTTTPSERRRAAAVVAGACGAVGARQSLKMKMQLLILLTLLAQDILSG